MGIKRKANDGEYSTFLDALPSPSSINTSPNGNRYSKSPSRDGWSSPGSHYANEHLNTSLSVSTFSNDSHLNSRTRKRFRNDRPEDEIVHQETMSKLFRAQRSDSIAPMNQVPDYAPPTPCSISDNSLCDAMDIADWMPTSLEPQPDKAQMSLLSYFPTRGHTRISKSEPPQNHMQQTQITPPNKPNIPNMGYNDDIGPDPQSSTQSRPRPNFFRHQAFPIQSTLSFYEHGSSFSQSVPILVHNDPLAEAGEGCSEMELDNVSF